MHVFEFDWDGERAVAICADEPTESAWYGAHVALLDLDARTAERVYEPEWQIQCPVLAGDSVWFVEGFCSDRGVLAGDVKVVDLGRRDVRDIAVENTDVSFLARRDGDRIWFAGLRGMGSVCGTLSAAGEVDELWAGDAVVGARFQPYVAAGGDRLLSIFESPDRAPEVVELDDGDWRALSDLNGTIPDPNGAGTWEARTWSAADGLEIEGLLLVPHEGDAPYPLIVCVHGGPTGAWSWSFLPAGSPGPLLAQEGYAVLLPNPRGSAGRGQDFARANLGDMGGGDLQDILAGVEALVEEGLVDTDRVGVYGGSYGGFMSAWAVTQTDRFHASIPLAAVTDWRSFHLTTNIGRFDALFLDADPFEVGGEYDARSPVVQAKNAQDADADGARGGGPVRARQPGAGDVPGARRGRVRDRARPVSARGSRLHRARAPARPVGTDARLVRALRAASGQRIGRLSAPYGNASAGSGVDDAIEQRPRRRSRR